MISVEWEGKEIMCNIYAHWHSQTEKKPTQVTLEYSE